MIIQNDKYVKLRYIYSASVVVETPDLTILSDPWFTPAEYGSWYHYPPLPKDPIEIIYQVKPSILQISGYLGANAVGFLGFGGLLYG